MISYSTSGQAVPVRAAAVYSTMFRDLPWRSRLKHWFRRLLRRER